MAENFLNEVFCHHFFIYFAGKNKKNTQKSKQFPRVLMAAGEGFELSQRCKIVSNAGILPGKWWLSVNRC